MPVVGGLDGCRAGWVLATMPARGALARGDGPDVRVVPCLDEVVAALESGRLAAAAIDIPIGLPADGSRECDLEARRLLGPRRSSVFPAPVRAALGAGTYAEACGVSRAISGKGLSRQLYNILGKIREVDALQSPSLQERLFEACPELSFALMSHGVPMRHNKRTLEGRVERVVAFARVRVRRRHADRGRAAGGSCRATTSSMRSPWPGPPAATSPVRGAGSVGRETSRDCAWK